MKSSTFKLINEFEKQITQLQNENAILKISSNEFIKGIAEMLDMDADGIGYDGLQLTLDDFEEAIKNLTNKNQK